MGCTVILLHGTNLLGNIGTLQAVETAGKPPCQLGYGGDGGGGEGKVP